MSSVFFDLYVVRVVGYCLGILPVTVAYVTAKFSVLPLAVLRSFAPEQANAGHESSLALLLTSSASSMLTCNCAVLNSDRSEVFPERANEF